MTPNQPLEAKYGLTRRCLEELVKYQFPVNIQTKSKLVLRDLDLFREFEEIDVGFTITTDSDQVARLFEPGASSIRERMTALEQLHSSGIRTFAFVGPLLPGDPENLIAQLDGKVDKVLIDRMNYASAIKGFYSKLDMEKEISDRFFDEYKQRLVSELNKRRIHFEVFF